MIYLETYENNEVHKTYIIVSKTFIFVHNYLYLYRVLDLYQGSYQLELLYTYSYKNNKIIKIETEHIEYELKNTLSNSIVYQSDSLDECMEYLKMVIGIKKYNL